MPRGHAPFAFFNATGNRVVRGLLRSPAHRVAGSRRIALVTYTGRKSGRQFTIPVFYKRQGNDVEIGVDWPERKVWWRNLRGDGGPVELVLRGERRRGHAKAVGGEKSGVTVHVRLEPDGGGDAGG